LFNQANAAVMPDGKSAVFASSHGGLTRIYSIPIDGSAPAQPLFALTLPAYTLDTRSDGSIYLDQMDRPVDVIRFPAEGGHVERVASVPKPAGNSFAALPEGRAVWIEYVASQSRLMIREAGKEAVPFVNTTEETKGPLAAIGSGEVAFMIGPNPPAGASRAALLLTRATLMRSLPHRTARCSIARRRARSGPRPGSHPGLAARRAGFGRAIS
jgi:hypothetical protein